MRQVEGCESQIGKCRMDMGSLSCGPYQIKSPYWIDCGSPGGGTAKAVTGNTLVSCNLTDVSVIWNQIIFAILASTADVYFTDAKACEGG